MSNLDDLRVCVDASPVKLYGEEIWTVRVRDACDGFVLRLQSGD